VRCPAPLLYFVKPSELEARELASLEQHAARCASCGARSTRAARARAALRSELPLSLSRCSDSIQLARYLQGRLDGPERELFSDHLPGCEPCLAELAFAMRAWAPRAVGGRLEKRLRALFESSQDSLGVVGRSKEVFGDQRSSIEASPKVPRARPTTRRREGRASLVASANADEKVEETKPLSVEQVRAAGEALARASSVEVEAKQGRQVIPALIGAALMFVLAVAPLFAITRDLFRRARTAEIRLATTKLTLRRSMEATTRISERLREAETELKLRPTRGAFDAQQQSQKILKAALGRAVQLQRQQRERSARALREGRKELARVEADSGARLLKERDLFAGRLYNALAGIEGDPPRPPLSRVLEELEGSDERRVVASFYLLELKGLAALAVEVARGRPKLSLAHFLARPAFASTTVDQRRAFVIRCLVHPAAAVRAKSAALLAAAGVDLLGYRTGEPESKRALQAAALAARWAEAKGEEFPYPLSFEGDMQGDTQRWRASGGASAPSGER
jgi:hypothetical protein